VLTFIHTKMTLKMMRVKTYLSSRGVIVIVLFRLICLRFWNDARSISLSYFFY